MKDRLNTKRPLSPAESLVRKWIVLNKGILSRIARAHKVSPQFIQQLAYGRATAQNHPALRDLRTAGWPGSNRNN